MRKLTFAAGFAVGYTLGARAGRERYEQLQRLYRTAAENPAVQETAGVLQAQASGLVGTAKRKLGAAVTERIGGRQTHDGAGRSTYEAPYPAGAAGR